MPGGAPRVRPNRPKALSTSRTTSRQPAILLRGAASNTRKLLTHAFAPDVAKRLLDRLTKALGADAASFDAIQKADLQLLAKFIHNEHPPKVDRKVLTIALKGASEQLRSQILSSRGSLGSRRFLPAHEYRGQRIAQRRSQAENTVEEQRRVMLEARQRLRLLEKLKQRRYAE